MRVVRTTALVLLVIASRASAQDAPSPPAAGGGGPAASPKPAPPPMTPEQAADAVLAAFGATDEAGLKALAAHDDPDPWIVADELVRRERHDAAEAFARGAPRPDTAALPAYVASRRGRPDDPVRRDRIVKATAAVVRGRLADALSELGDVESPPVDDVVGVRLLYGRARTYLDLTRFADATSAARAAAAMGERIGWSARARVALLVAGTAAYRSASFRVAVELWERHLDACVRDGARTETLHALNNLGLARFALADYERAMSLFERAMAAREARGDRAEVAVLRGAIAGVHYARGAFSRAVEGYDRAIAELEELRRDDYLATVLGNAGAAYARIGAYGRAKPAFERALALHEAKGDRAGAARALAGIGSAVSSQGEFARALGIHERALAILEALGDRAAAATTLGNIGGVYLRIGDLPRARSALERALSVKEAIGDRAGAVGILRGLGVLALSAGDPAQALVLHERELVLREQLGDADGVATALANLGAAHLALGAPARALPVLERALKTAETAGARSAAALVRSNIGAALLAQGEREQALPVLERAREELEAVGDRATEALALMSLVDLHLTLGDRKRAVSYAREAVERIEAVSRGLGADESEGARAQYADLHDVGASAAVRAGDVDAMSYFLESGRARALLEGLAAREALWSAAIPEALRADEASARAAETRATEALRKALDAGALAETRARRADLDAARERVAAVVSRIQREVKTGAEILYPRAAGLDEIRGALEPAEALVLYAVHGSSAAAIVVTRGEARIVPLGERSAIESAAEALMGALADAGSDAGPHVRTLADLVAKPLGLAAGTTRVLVSPAGGLSYVPFAALIPDRTVTYVPSGTAHLRLRGDEALRGDEVLALGDPDYSVRTDDRALEIHRGGLGRLTRLPATRDEVAAIGGTTLLGAEATEAGLRDALGRRPRWRAVHLACHGLVNSERPAFSSLALTPAGEDDGFLSCLDVFRMKIPSDLVVLSACETAKGKVVRGEGIVGLTRAFMYAGSPRVICSLWKVDDEATKALMVRFYELWNPKDGKAGVPTAEALRKAQEFVKSQERWKHPYYWAAWVLWGLPD